MGSGPGKVNLYRGKVCVERNVSSEEAVERLLALIDKDKAAHAQDVSCATGSTDSLSIMSPLPHCRVAEGMFVAQLSFVFSCCLTLYLHRPPLPIYI